MYVFIIPTFFVIIYLCAHGYYIYTWNSTSNTNSLRSSNNDDSYVLL